jgi:hypothetical protein
MSGLDASALRGRRTALDVRWTLSPDGSALATWCPLGARAFDFSVRPIGGRWLATVERGMRSSTCVATRDEGQLWCEEVAWMIRAEEMGR